MTRAYAELGATAGTRKKYAVQFEGYSDVRMSQDTIQVSVTGKLLTHRGTQFKRWVGQFRVYGTPEDGYGSISDLETLYAAQSSSMSWLAPEEEDATTVTWMGSYQPRYVRPPLDINVVPFVLSEVG